jgi:nitrate reductase NapE component
MVDDLRSDRGRDPLAGLARLIAEDDVYAQSESGDHVNERRSNADERCKPSPPSAPTHSHAARERGYEKESAGRRYVSGPAVQFDGFREEPTPNEPDEAAWLPPGHHLSPAAAYEIAPERSYETTDEHGYQDQAYVADDKAADEDHADVQSARQRNGLVLVMAIFGLAVVGAAGAFGYRAISGGPVPPTLPPISKANKIAPVSDLLENATNTNEARATATGSTENPVPREEQSVKPRVIRTIPIMSGQGWLPGPASLPRLRLLPPFRWAPSREMPGPVMWSGLLLLPWRLRRLPQLPRPYRHPRLRLCPSRRRSTRPRTTINRVQRTPGLSRPLLPPSAAPAAPSVSGGGYAVQVTSERSESTAQAALQALQAKYPNQLSGHQPIIRRADLGAKGIYYRVLVGTFASAEEAAGLCSKLKAAGANCIVQRN